MSSSTFTPNLGIEQPATGAYPNTWGNVANRSYAVLDAAIGSNASITLTGVPGLPQNLPTAPGTDPSQGLYPLLIWTGPQQAAGAVTISPNTQQRLFIMKNQTAATIAFSQGTGSAFTLQPGCDAQLYCDGLGPAANVAAALDSPQFRNVLVTGVLTIQGSLTGNLNLGNVNAATLGLGSPLAVPDPLTINALGPNGQCQLRLVESLASNYGALLRNDGNAFYILTTSANIPYGNFNSLRPLTIDLASGAVGVGGAGPNASYGLSATSIHSTASIYVDAVVNTNTLSAVGGIQVDSANTNGGGIDIYFGGPGTTEGIGSARTGGASANQGGLSFFTANAARLVILSNGQVAVNMFPIDSSAFTVSGAIRTTGGIVFPDGSVQTTAVSGTLTSLQVNGNANITGTLNVGGLVTVSNDVNLTAGHVYRINNVPLSTGIPGVTVYVGPPLWTEPGIAFSAGVGMSIVASHNSPGNYGTLTFNNTAASDERVKRNVRPLQGGLSVLSQLHPIEGEYNGLGGTREGERVVGVMAQELRRLLPGCVMSVRGKLRKDDAEETDLLYVNTQELIYQMLLAIQQLYGRSEMLYGRHL